MRNSGMQDSGMQDGGIRNSGLRLGRGRNRGTQRARWRMAIMSLAGALIITSCSTTVKTSNDGSTKRTTTSVSRSHIELTLAQVSSKLEKGGFTCTESPDDGASVADIFDPFGRKIQAPIAQLECELDDDTLTFLWWKSASLLEANEQSMIDTGLALACPDTGRTGFATLSSGAMLAIPEFSSHTSFSGSFSTDGTATTVPPRTSTRTDASAKAMARAATLLGLTPRTSTCSDFLERLESGQPANAPEDLDAVTKRLEAAGFTCATSDADATGSSADPFAGLGSGETGGVGCTRDGVEFAVVFWKDLGERVSAMQMVAAFSMMGCGSKLRATHLMGAHAWLAVLFEESSSDSAKVDAAVRDAEKALDVRVQTQNCPSRPSGSPSSTSTPTTLVAPADAPDTIDDVIERLEQAGFTCQKPPMEQNVDEASKGPHWLSSCTYGDMGFDVSAWDDARAREADIDMALDPFFNAECDNDAATSFRFIAARGWQLSADPDAGIGETPDWTALDAQITRGMNAASQALAVPIATHSCDD